MKKDEHLLTGFPEPGELLNLYSRQEPVIDPVVNNHIHSPYSFSAFSNIAQSVALAVKEGINVLGINDFFVRDGYREFADECMKHQVFPLFNIEFIGLSKTDQKAGIRVNDPGNPGRTYISGKGLQFPPVASDESTRKMEAVISESQHQVAAMTEKLNEHIRRAGYDLALSMELIRQRFAMNLVRERHLATALRILAGEHFQDPGEQLQFFTKLFNGTPPVSDPGNHAAFENEIRNRLLKAGGAAFVPEDEKAFLGVEEIRELILDMGGIPTYPMLLDDANGNITDFEFPKEALLKRLQARGFSSVEMIPHRNSLQHLQTYATFFYENGFIVSFGTEHNTPELTPLRVNCRNCVELTEPLLTIGQNGAAVIAAHQYLHARGKTGFVNAHGRPGPENRHALEQLGRAIFAWYFSNNG